MARKHTIHCISPSHLTIILPVHVQHGACLEQEETMHKNPINLRRHGAAEEAFGLSLRLDRFALQTDEPERHLVHGPVHLLLQHRPVA